MNITSAIVYSYPRQAAVVRASLAGIPGVEIHQQTDDGRFIVTVEDAPGATVADTVMYLHRLDGVLFAAMVYQYSDESAGREGEPS